MAEKEGKIVPIRIRGEMETPSVKAFGFATFPKGTASAAAKKFPA